MMNTEILIKIWLYSTVLIGSQFMQAQNLVGNIILASDEFDGTGDAVAISDVGNRIIVGSDLKTVNNVEKAGVTKVYQLNGDTWEQLGQDISGTLDDEEVGNSVCISSDGNRIAVGSSLGAMVYDLVGSSWQQVGSLLTLPIMEAGADIDELKFSDDANTIVVGGNSTGIEVVVFELSGNQWVQKGNDLPIDLRLDVALSGDGNRIAAYAASTVQQFDKDIHVYEFQNNVWTIVGDIIKLPDGYRWSEAFDMAGNGKRVITALENKNGSSDGAIATYDLIDGAWVLNESFPSLDVFTTFGPSLRVSHDGNTFVFGNSYDFSVIDETSVVVYQFINEQWELLGSMLPGATHDESAEGHVDITADGSRIVMGGNKNSPGDFRGFVKVYDYGAFVGVEDQTNKTDVKLYPNPTSGNFTVKMSELNSAITDIVVYDIWGQTILSERIQSSSKKYQFSIASQPAGIYIVKLMNEEQEFLTEKVIKL